MISALVPVLIAAGAVMVVIVLLLWWSQERIVFQPPGPPHPDAGAVRRVDYTASDGQPLFAYVIGDRERAARAPGARVVLAFHGNADLAVRLIPWGEEVARRTGAMVVLAEYRGYAGLGGRPTYAGSRLDARAAYDVIRDSLGAAPGEIAIFGHSLGTAIGAELAASLPEGEAPYSLVLQSPFTSAKDMARLIVFRPALLAWQAISRVHFDTEARVRQLRAPVWVSHGTRDFVIPVRMGRRVHESAAVRGELLIVPGAGHNDVPEAAGEDYWRWLGRAFGADSSGG